MSRRMAFRAEYSDLKLIKTRQVVQVIFELPLADFDVAYEILGGMPNPSVSRWFGIAALKEEVLGKTDVITHKPETASPGLPSQAKRSFRDIPLAQQAGIRCEDMMFSAFLRESYPDEWHDLEADPAACVRTICGVGSRADLETNHKARVIWKQLNDKFEAWKTLETAR